MQKYQNYKTTNIKWTDQIPVDWSEIPLRKVFEDVKNTNTNGDHIRMLSLVKDIGIIPYEERGNQGNKSSEKLEKYKIVEKGDFVINKMNAVLGSLGISEYEGLVSPVYYVLRNRNEDEFVSRYFELIFKTRSVQRFLRTMSKGIMEIRESVDWAELKNMALPLPSIEDQRSIVEYVNRVDKLTRDFIKQKQKYIELLKEYKQSKINELVTKGLDPNVKMKDSGIVYIGEIPEEWSVKPLKKITHQIVDGTHFTPNYTNMGIPFLRVTDITGSNKDIDLENVKYISENEHKELSQRCHPEKGDVLLSKNGTIGVTKVVDWDWTFSIFVSLCLIKLKNDAMTSDYLCSSFQANYLINQVKDSGKSNTVTNLHLDKIRELNVVLPPLQQQEIINREIHKIVENIDGSISKSHNQIKTIRKYRQSLVYELVTGIRKP